MNDAEFRRMAYALLFAEEWDANTGGDEFCPTCKALRHEGEKHKLRCKRAALLAAGPGGGLRSEQREEE